MCKGSFVRIICMPKIRLPEIKLTPIPCILCGFQGSGRYANRSNVCRYCQRRFRKELLKHDL